MINMNEAKVLIFLCYMVEKLMRNLCMVFASYAEGKKQHKFTFGLFVLVLRYHKYLKAL